MSLTTFSHLQKEHSKVANRLRKSSNSVSALQTYDTIPDDDAWKIIDDTLYDSIRDNMVIANDILGDQSLINSYNDLGKTVVKWYDVDEQVDGTVSMSGQPKGDSGGAISNVNTLPIPILRVDWTMPTRNLEAFQNDEISNEAIDTRMNAAAGRRLGKMTENLFLEGADITVNGSGIPGLLNHPDRVTGSITEDWDGTFDTDLIGDIEDDVLSIIKDAKDNGAPSGSDVIDIYIPTSAETNLNRTINDQNSRTVLDIIKEKPSVGNVKFSDYLDNKSPFTVLGIYRSPEFMTVERAADFANVEWEPTGEMVYNWASLGAQVLRVTPSFDNKVPIVVYS